MIGNEEHTIPTLVDHIRAGKILRRHLIKVLTALGISVGGISAIVAAKKKETPLDVAAKVAEGAAEQLQLHDQHINYQSQGAHKRITPRLC